MIVGDCAGRIIAVEGEEGAGEGMVLEVEDFAAINQRGGFVEIGFKKICVVRLIFFQGQVGKCKGVGNLVGD